MGGAGDDFYRLAAGDVVVEVLNQGMDTVATDAAVLTLTANVETLLATSAAAHRFTGNGVANLMVADAGADTLSGLGGNDTLDGRDGIDRLVGGLGDDLYIVTAGDVVVEMLNQGTDTVQSGAATLTLAGNVEVMAATTAIAHRFTGNVLANLIIGHDGADTLIGGQGNDTLDGGAGADRLLGGLHDDLYILGAGDVAVETANQGLDTVLATAGTAVTLGANIEVLLLGADSIANATGNALDNLMGGSAGANVLRGLAGADTMHGEGGADILIGGAGRDVLSGGGRGDQFRLLALSDSTVAAPDVIADFTFNATDGFDRVDFRTLDANAIAGGNQAFTYIGAAAFGGSGAASAGQLRVTQQVAGTWLAAGDVNGDGAADVAVTILASSGPVGGWFLL